MTDAPQRHPLAWPPHKARRKWSERILGTFSSDGAKITFAAATQRLEEEIHRLGGVYPILSSNLELRMDGTPKVGRDNAPEDPGVCAYFQIKGVPYAMACDTYTQVQQNVAAIAEHIKATRLIVRYGVASAAETLQAFQALPAPAQAKPKRPWWVVLGVDRAGVDKDDVAAVYRSKARKLHPDTGAADTEAMAELNVAKAEALAELKV